MDDDRIPIGGAIMPITVLSMDEEDLMKIYRPKINREKTMTIAFMISNIFDLQSILKYPVINLSPYPASQLLNRPDDLRRIIMGSSAATYIASLAGKGYRDKEIEEILSSRRRFDEAFSGIPFIAIGYDHEVLRRNIETLPKDLWFPPPEPSRNNLMERLSDRARGFLSSSDVRYIDLALMIISGVNISIENTLSWIYSMSDNQKEVAEKLFILSDILDYSYGFEASTTLAGPLIPAPLYDDEKKAKEFLEDIVEKSIEGIENMSNILAGAFKNKWLTYI
jgi:hypothetical protein